MYGAALCIVSCGWRKFKLSNISSNLKERSSGHKSPDYATELGHHHQQPLDANGTSTQKLKLKTQSNFLILDKAKGNDYQPCSPDLESDRFSKFPFKCLFIWLIMYLHFCFAWAECWSHWGTVQCITRVWIYSPCGIPALDIVFHQGTDFPQGFSGVHNILLFGLQAIRLFNNCVQSSQGVLKEEPQISITGCCHKICHVTCGYIDPTGWVTCPVNDLPVLDPHVAMSAYSVHLGFTAFRIVRHQYLSVSIQIPVFLESFLNCHLPVLRIWLYAHVIQDQYSRDVHRTKLVSVIIDVLVYSRRDLWGWGVLEWNQMRRSPFKQPTHDSPNVRWEKQSSRKHDDHSKKNFLGRLHFQSCNVTFMGMLSRDNEITANEFMTIWAPELQCAASIACAEFLIPVGGFVIAMAVAEAWDPD